jgi:outer membrane murein-binding lipoprotein Lpp
MKTLAIAATLVSSLVMTGCSGVPDNIDAIDNDKYSELYTQIVDFNSTNCEDYVKNLQSANDLYSSFTKLSKEIISENEDLIPQIRKNLEEVGGMLGNRSETCMVEVHGQGYFKYQNIVQNFNALVDGTPNYGHCTGRFNYVSTNAAKTHRLLDSGYQNGEISKEITEVFKTLVRNKLLNTYGNCF